MYEASHYLKVIEIKVLDKQRLSVKFNDGVVKEIDLTPLIQNPPPVFVKLTDEQEFKTVRVNPVGGISWACGADLSAEYLRSL